MYNVSLYLLQVSTFTIQYLYGDVMMSTSSAVDHEFGPHHESTKNYEIGICCLFAKHAAWGARIKIG